MEPPAAVTLNLEPTLREAQNSERKRRPFGEVTLEAQSCGKVPLYESGFRGARKMDNN